MTRLIDADALHDDLKAKQKWIVKREDKHNEGYTYDQVHFAIDEQPTVDAVPVQFIQQRIDELAELAEFEFESSGGYTGKAHTQIYELRRLINYWKEERARYQP